MSKQPDLHPSNGRTQRVAIVANPDKKRAKQEIPRLTAWFKRRGIHSIATKDFSSVDAVLTLGGDGTILSIAAAAAEAGVPVLGVNVGWLGFMTAVELSRVYQGLEAWLDGKWTVSERLMLEVTPPRMKKAFHALNDVVIRVGSTPRLTTISASVDNEFLGRFRGDGLIVSTPTGSTAYSMAAQGPVVHPDVEALILTPICAHSFTQRPVVFPGGQTIELKLEDGHKKNDVQLCLDGQRVFPMRAEDRVFVRVSPNKLKLLNNPTVPYFRVLREKLSWGEQ